jgi:uncharacterized RDD family membrane protein YckC
MYKTNLKKRITATVIDYFIFILFFYIYVTIFGYDNNEGGKTVTGVKALGIPLFWFFYFVVVEGFWGATLAHQALYLKVLTVDRKEISIANSFKRRLLDFIDIFFFGIPAIITIKNTPKHQRTGDLWAKTIVVDTKDTEQMEH